MELYTIEQTRSSHIYIYIYIYIYIIRYIQSEWQSQHHISLASTLSEDHFPQMSSTFCILCLSSVSWEKLYVSRVAERHGLGVHIPRCLLRSAFGLHILIHMFARSWKHMLIHMFPRSWQPHGVASCVHVFSKQMM